jgi:hypothetical protein
MHLMLSLSQNPYTAEALAVNGIMMTLSNDSFSIFKEISQPYQSGERNRWHRTWCMMISIITSILRTLGHSERFLEQCLEFANIHQNRLMAVMTPPAVLTIGGLEEAERITGFLYQVSHYSERWRLVYNAMATKLQNGIIQLVQHYVLLLLQPNLLARAALPVSKDEKRADSVAALPTSTAVPFSQLIEQHIFIVLRNALSIIRLLTPNPLSKTEQDWQHWIPLFASSLETSVAAPASLGILLACLVRHLLVYSYIIFRTCV